MATDLARKAAEIASRDVGDREALGPNDSMRIRQYLHTVGLPIGKGYPYCAAAVCTWVLEAGFELGQPDFNFNFSGSALSLGHKNQDLCHFPKDLVPDMIPCVGVEDHGNGKGHAYLIVGMDQDGNLQTIEANTNVAGGREGDGVYAKDTRSMHDKKLAWIVEIK